MLAFVRQLRAAMAVVARLAEAFRVKWLVDVGAGRHLLRTALLLGDHLAVQFRRATVLLLGLL